MPKSEFGKQIEDYMSDLKKASKILDVSHLSVEGMEDTPDVGIPFNRALSYIESAKALVDQARKNLDAVLKASRLSKIRRK